HGSQDPVSTAMCCDGENQACGCSAAYAVIDPSGHSRTTRSIRYSGTCTRGHSFVGAWRWRDTISRIVAKSLKVLGSNPCHILWGPLAFVGGSQYGTRERRSQRSTR